MAAEAVPLKAAGSLEILQPPGHPSGMHLGAVGRNKRDTPKLCSETFQKMRNICSGRFTEIRNKPKPYYETHQEMRNNPKLHSETIQESRNAHKLF